MKVTTKIFVVVLILSLIFTVGAVASAENMTFDQSDMGTVFDKTDIELSGKDDALTAVSEDEDDSDDEDLLKSDESFDAEDVILGSDGSSDSSNLLRDDQSRTLYINVSAPSGGDGSIDNPYNSLLRISGNTKDGDIIYIAGGTYPRVGNIVLNAGVTLTQWGSEEVIFDGDGYTSPALQILSDNVNINRITFKNYNSIAMNVHAQARKITVENCRFINNDVAIEFQNGAENSKITGDFIDNVQSIRLLLLESVNCTIDANFKNTVFPQGSTSHQAILVHSVRECTFNGKFINHCTLSGAAIGIQNNAYYSKFNAEFTNNVANEGGAIYIGGDVGGCEFNGVFNNNEASNGSAIYLKGNVMGSNFNGNFISNTAGESGTLFFFNQLVVCNFNGLYENNKANNGGVAYVRIYAAVNNFNGEFIRNSATSNGGALYFDDYQIISNNFGGNFKGNSAASAGAIYIGKRANLCNFSGNFTDNVADIAAGAISLPEGISNSNFTGNFANNSVKASYGSGGAIAVSNVTSKVNFGGNFINNTVSYNGAAIFCYIVKDTNFKANFIQNSGGNIVRIGNASGNNNFIGCLFVQNKAETLILAETANDFDVRYNVFLNNECEYCVNVNNGQYGGNDNWFGQTADNYLTSPRNMMGGNVNLNSWLFLNASANPNTVLISNSSNIIFKLFRYNRLVWNFDNKVLPTIGLRLTSTKGYLDRDVAGLDETFKYNPTQMGTADITATVETVSLTINVKNVQDPKLSINADNVDYLENILINLNYDNSATGKVNITLTSANHKYNYLMDINPTIVLSNVLPGNYGLNVTYLGDSYFIPANANQALTVYRSEPNIRAIGHDRLVNDVGEVVLTIVLPGNATGNLTVKFLNKTSDPIDVSSGEKIGDKLIINLTDDSLPVGQYDVTVIYSGDEIYKNSSDETSFNVLRISTEIMTGQTIELFIGNESAISYDLTPPDATGEIEFFTSDSGIVEVNSLTGHIKAVGAGNATITIYFTGHGDFDDSNSTIIVMVKKLNPDLSFDKQEVEYNGNTSIRLNYNSQATGNVNMTLNGKRHDYILENIMLEEIISLGNVFADEYEVIIVYSGDDNFMNSTANGTLIVKKVKSNMLVEAHDINVTDSNGVMFTILLPEHATGNLSINNASSIDVVNEGKLENGKLVVEIMNNALPVGEYDWSFAYLGDDNYINSTSGGLSKIFIMVTSIVPVNDFMELKFGEYSKVEYISNPSQLQGITFKSSNSSVVTVDANGIVNAVGAGSARILIEFNGNENYTSSDAVVSVSVIKADSSLTVNDMAFDYGSTGSVVASFENASGIVATVDDSNAVVSVDGSVISVSNLPPGTYVLTVTTITDANHNNLTRNALITVNKIKSQLSADSLTTTYNINRNLVISLKDAGGNPLVNAKVTVDLKGAKTYFTNNNGQVIISAGALVPATYNVKVSFMGDAFCDASYKEVKVKVKKATPKMTAKKKTFKKSTKIKKYTIKLNNVGKAIKKAKITLKVKGKTYKAKTNSKGKATFKIKKLNRKGTFKAVIKYKGDKFYNKIVKNVKIKVK